MDNIKFGKQFKHHIDPPAVPTDGDMQTFVSSDLKAVIERKLSALNSRDFYILQKSGTIIKKIQQLTKHGSLEEWFCLEYAAAELEEHFYIFRWQKYWLAIWEKLNPQKIASHVTETIDIPRAKAFPIDQLYPNQLRQFGGKLTGLCPFHEERTPSFFIFPDNHYHCYGCQAHGDAIDFVMKLKGFEFQEAVRSLT